MIPVTNTKRGDTVADEAADLTTVQAAKVLGVNRQTVWAYIGEGWLVPKTRSGVRGRGRRAWLDRGEVEAFLAGGAPAAAAYRSRKAKRGRKP